MKGHRNKKMFVLLLGVLLLMVGCSSEEVKSLTNAPDGLSMIVENYTKTFKRTITIKDTQGGSFLVGMEPLEGKIKIEITDGQGEEILSMNQEASLSDYPIETKVAQGNGTYHLKVSLDDYSGSFTVSWKIGQKQEKQEPSGVSDDVTEHGLLDSYDWNSRVLTYTPIEMVMDTDTKRIEELEAMGVELDFPNGYFMYQPNEMQLNLPVSEDVKVSLLNDDCTLYETDITELADILEGHPTFYLCQLHIVEGIVVGIEEVFVP